MGWTTPRTWVAGEYPTAAELNAHLRDNLNAAFPLGGVDGAWISYTPTLTQSGAVTKTVTYARYTKIGRLVIVTFFLSVTGTGTGGQKITVSLPVTASQGADTACGHGYVYDQSATTDYVGVMVLTTTTTFAFFPSNATSGSGYLGSQGFTAAFASGDIIGGTGMYESAS